MLLDVLRSRRVLFVGGKGGVGKTSISSAIALARAREGARVLVVSTDPAHNLGHLWGAEVGDEPVRLATAAHGYVDGIEIDPRATVDRHLAAVHDAMRRILPERMHPHAKRHLELAREAPGSHEAAVLERVADTVELAREHYDLLVFDTAPSGHTLRLMALPRQLGDWTETLLANRDRSERFSSAMRGLASGRDSDPERSGDALIRQALLRRRGRFELLQRTVADPLATGFVIVSVAEPMPVAETLELSESLRRIGVDIAALVVNRRSPQDAGELLAARRRLEDRGLRALEDRLPGVPLAEVPLLGGDPRGEAAVAALADALP
ncbi:ArsA family ATPase [Leucobacter sp. CSA1]|uniref:ArsA family ATPase n=1 Tax=Leucobacter chromiisoli TaxID=2796471 RepID=A0A934Q7Z1_9MICO|nr:ArsA family ATPase [Leucobacter chromiisoli]MBK0419909.1 ArsA family ATPase [Leucobacter chromiisoli]